MCEPPVIISLCSRPYSRAGLPVVPLSSVYCKQGREGGASAAWRLRCSLHPFAGKITETSAWPWGERPAIDFNGLYFDRTDNGHSYYADTDATIHGPTTTAGTFESNCKVTSTGRMAARGSASAPEGLRTILETSRDFDQKSELHRGCAPGPPARLQRVDRSCHQQSRRI